MRKSLVFLITFFWTLLQPAGLVWSGETQTTLWPQWRGPTRDAKVPGTPKWPGNLDGLKKSWRVELGPGYSGPIVAPDRVFVTETQNKKWEIVRALDRKTGDELWRSKWEGAMSVPFFAKANGDWIRSTPAYDGESLFVAGMRDVLVCLDAQSGAERWRVNFMERYETNLPAFGFVSSPLVIGNHVFVQAGASFIKLDKKTGKTVWRTLEDGGGMYGSAFSSPYPATIHGKSQILVQGREKLVGVDPESGEMLWSQLVPSFRGMNILTPTVYNNGIFTSTHRNKTFFYQIRKKGSEYGVKESWTNKAQGYMSSPVLIGDYAYLHLGNGRLACFDLRTGEQKWRSKSFGKYWSMVVQEDLILALDERGSLILIKANPEKFELLDSKQVSEEDTWGHIAVCAGEIYVRELQGISKFVWSLPKPE